MASELKAAIKMHSEIKSYILSASSVMETKKNWFSFVVMWLD